MSDPDVSQPEKPADVNDVVDSAKAGLDAAAAAGADVPGAGEQTPAVAETVDPDLVAFEAAEQTSPGAFSAPVSKEASSAPVETAEGADATAVLSASLAPKPPAMADAAYAPPVVDPETRVLPAEPASAEPASAEPLLAAPPLAQQPIFVQAPEPPRERGNRGTAGAIGLLATVAFAVLYLGATLALGALVGDVNGQNIVQAALAPLVTWGFWVPVVVFFLGFWLLGAFINRGRWGLWVVFGILVGVIAYGGHLLGQLFEAPFWQLSASQGAELVGSQLLAPLAIAAFVFARELTIWFGAWIARSGARKTELNVEAQREYERTLEAGPTLAR